MRDPIVCQPRLLPREKWISAADNAVKVNPMNHAPVERLALIMPGFRPTREHLAVVTTKWWHTDGVKLTVGFLDTTPIALRKRILLHMNAWGKTAKVSFALTNHDPQVRILRTADDGYWSYVGTDILSIPPNEPTMNLDSFTMDTPESEFHRVVRHETGHTMGFPHEHMRSELVAKIDLDKAIEFFGRTQGWTPEMVEAQVLTPIENGSLIGTAHADPKSIMCYQIPGVITKDGKPIIGGLDIDTLDFQFAASIYPKKPARKSTSTRKAHGKAAA